MIAAVFDCVVFVHAVLSRKGPAFACLQLAEAEHVTHPPIPYRPSRVGTL